MSTVHLPSHSNNDHFRQSCVDKSKIGFFIVFFTEHAMNVAQTRAHAKTNKQDEKIGSCGNIITIDLNTQLGYLY